MKNFDLKSVLVSALAAALFLTFFFPAPAFSQEAAKKEKNKTIMLKVVSDDNGTTSVIDTTFEMPDSAMVDSIRQEVDKVIEMTRGGRHGKIKIHTMPDGYDYNFDIPCIPDCPMDLQGLQDLGIDFNWDGMPPCPEFGDDACCEGMPRLERRIMRAGGEGRSLNDILGDIPMERVKSYTIKDRKNGKRITIDIDDAPMFDRQEKVIIIREPGKAHRQGSPQQRKVKVYMTPDDKDVKVEKIEKEVPPPPPPPKKK
jgi:hypothetical protein